VPRYRYRTAALTGPWRDSPDEAARDAVRAKQAQIDEDQPAAVKWIVPGRIEERNNEEAPSRVTR
jgi:flavin-binding protein dodecin